MSQNRHDALDSYITLAAAVVSRAIQDLSLSHLPAGSGTSLADFHGDALSFLCSAGCAELVESIDDSGPWRLREFLESRTARDGRLFFGASSMIEITPNLYKSIPEYVYVNELQAISLLRMSPQNLNYLRNRGHIRYRAGTPGRRGSALYCLVDLLAYADKRQIAVPGSILESVMEGALQAAKDAKKTD